jgi:pyruvate/2-oxoglutarate dehydrogenase complex dihydrolipoamide dehydrogenase (E3) component
MNQRQKLTPDDEFNKELVNNVSPDNWKNPEPALCYNLVVIGAGTGGLVTAAGAAGLGAKVALVERHLFGGDCLNYGCVPSKTIIHSSRVVSDINNCEPFGIQLKTSASANFTAVMERMRRIRARISSHDAVKRFADMGVDIFLGNASFTSSSKISIDGLELNFKKAVIATGA